MTVRQRLEEIRQTLQRRGGPVELDTIGELLGDLAVGAQDIERLLTQLEAAGCPIAMASPPVAQHLAVVLSTARDLTRLLGRAPRPTEIAESSGLALGSVRGALLFAQVLQR